MLIKYLSACLAFLLVASAGSDIRAQTRPLGWDPPLETRAVLTVHLARGDGSGSIELRQHDYVGIVVKAAFRGAEDLCTSSLQTGLDAANLDDAAAAWHVEARLVEIGQGEATVDLRWTRRVNRSDIVPRDSYTSEKRLVLRHGDSRILDLVRTTRQPTPECDSFGFTYELQFEGPRDLSNAAIAYDLWLVHQDADGELVTDRYQVTARQGEQVGYFFRPIRYSADGRRAADAPAVVMNVRGAIRGRMRTDGNIDLTVDGSRGFMNAGSTAWVGGQGRTLLTVKPGETVEVVNELPVGGTLSGFGDLRQAFGKNRTAVRITARRLW